MWRPIRPRKGRTIYLRIFDLSTSTINKGDKLDVSWYLIQCKVRQERLANLNLQQLGVQSLFPQFPRSKTARWQLHTVQEPLFPGYLFVNINLAKEFRKVAFAKGVLRVVMFGMQPAVVGEDIIQSINARIHDGFVVLSSSPTLRFDPGQVVHVNNGPFAGFEAIFEHEFSGTQRVALLMKAVAYQGRIIIDKNSVGF